MLNYVAAPTSQHYFYHNIFLISTELDPDSNLKQIELMEDFMTLCHGSSHRQKSRS